MTMTTRTRTPLEALQDEVKQAAERNEDCLVLADVDACDLFCRLARGHIDRLPVEEGCWYVGPEAFLTPFHVSMVRDRFADETVDVNTLWETDGHGGRIAVWTYQNLRSAFADPGFGERIGRSPLVVLADADYMALTGKKALLAHLLLCLPQRVQAVAVFSQDSGSEAAAWMETVRNKPCRTLEGEPGSGEKVPVLLASWDTLPLIHKKRVSGKVKRFLKENDRPFALEDPKTFAGLLSFLRSRPLTPAVLLADSVDQCDLCVRMAPQIDGGPRDVFLADHGPQGADPSELATALRKKLGVMNDRQHVTQAKHMESLFASGALDILVVPVDHIARLSAPAKTVVLLTSRHPLPEPPGSVGLNMADRYHMERIARPSAPGEKPVILIVNTPEMDIVEVKDLFVAPKRPLERTFHLDFPFVLGLLSCQRADVSELLRRVHNWDDRQDDAPDPLADLMASIGDELPDALCASPLAAMKLKDLFFAFNQGISDLENKVRNASSGRRRRLHTERLQSLEEDLELLPCHGCRHFQACHRRGHRKLRDLFESYHDLKWDVSNCFACAKIEWDDYWGCIEKLELIDSAFRLTPTGKLSQRFNLQYPMLLAKCVSDGLVGRTDNPAFDVSLAGAFVDDGGLDDIAQYDEFVFRDLAEKYDRIMDSVTPLRRVIYQMGTSPHKPVLVQAMVLMAWQTGMDLRYIARRIGIAEGTVRRLLVRATGLHQTIVG